MTSASQGVTQAGETKGPPEPQLPTGSPVASGEQVFRIFLGAAGAPKITDSNRATFQAAQQLFVSDKTVGHTFAVGKQGLLLQGQVLAMVAHSSVIAEGVRGYSIPPMMPAEAKGNSPATSVPEAKGADIVASVTNRPIFLGTGKVITTDSARGFALLWLTINGLPEAVLGGDYTLSDYFYFMDWADYFGYDEEDYYLVVEVIANILTKRRNDVEAEMRRLADVGRYYPKAQLRPTAVTVASGRPRPAPLITPEERVMLDRIYGRWSRQFINDPTNTPDFYQDMAKIADVLGTSASSDLELASRVANDVWEVARKRVKAVKGNYASEETKRWLPRIATALIDSFRSRREFGAVWSGSAGETNARDLVVTYAQAAGLPVPEDVLGPVPGPVLPATVPASLEAKAPPTLSSMSLAAPEVTKTLADYLYLPEVPSDEAERFVMAATMLLNPDTAKGYAFPLVMAVIDPVSGVLSELKLYGYYPCMMSRSTLIAGLAQHQDWRWQQPNRLNLIVEANPAELRGLAYVWLFINGVVDDITSGTPLGFTVKKLTDQDDAACYKWLQYFGANGVNLPFAGYGSTTNPTSAPDLVSEIAAIRRSGPKEEPTPAVGQ